MKANTLIKTIGIIFVVVISVLILFISATNYSWNKSDREFYDLSVERAVIEKLSAICVAETIFKNTRFKDKDNNSIGEYGLLAELAEYNKVIKEEFSSLFLDYNADSDCFRGSGYEYRIFLPTETSLQEQHWVCLALQKDGIGKGRSYYLDEKGIIFFTREEFLKDAPKNNPWPWLLKNAFFGTPFASPLKTTEWKILTRN